MKNDFIQSHSDICTKSKEVVFYSLGTFVGLFIASVPAMISLYTFFYLKKTKTSLWLIILSAFLLRLLLSALDPFLHNWDERFHALVAKNMMQFPFKPMLNKNPILPYNYTDWSSNNIWLHKQPLFLWQMAFSMKLFGVNEIALRLPSVLMGTISVYFIYKISEFWFKNEVTSFLSSLIFTFANYQLELTSGRLALDHNDVAFVFYVTASIWAFTCYLNSKFSIKWSITIGFLVGCAILNKWLTGLMVYSAWGMYIILAKNFRCNYKRYLDILISILTCCLIFLPWQIYISKNFPLESAWEFSSNIKHISEVMQGQHGGLFYHIRFLPNAYGSVLLIFLLVGSYFLIKDKRVDKNFSIAILTMTLGLFLFFSIIVKTKMPAFVYPANSIIISIIAFGFTKFLSLLSKRFPKKIFLQLVSVLILSIVDLNPFAIIKQSSKTLTERNAILNNTQIYKSIDKKVNAEYVILNCKSFEDKDLMFYSNLTAYAWYPNKKIFDSLQVIGFKFATFKNHSNQILPDYIQSNERVLFIDSEIK